MVFCSVLHEFYTYGEGISSVLKALAELYDLSLGDLLEGIGKRKEALSDLITLELGISKKDSLYECGRAFDVFTLVLLRRLLTPWMPRPRLSVPNVPCTPSLYSTTRPFSRIKIWSARCTVCRR